MHKEFVGVTTQWTPDGKIIPTEIQWEDGRKFTVDRVLDVRPAASLTAGGTGIRYTIRVRGKETFLFRAQYLWFLEATSCCLNARGWYAGVFAVSTKEQSDRAALLWYSNNKQILSARITVQIVTLHQSAAAAGRFPARRTREEKR